MKFGKYLARRQLELPEYINHFINYKALKKLIKSLSNESLTTSVEQKLRENKATFFFRLERELEKVNSFYLQKEAELNLRLNILCEKKTVAYRTGNLISKSSINYISLYEGFQRFRRDLVKLEQFIELNQTGFSKVLKKWDKRSKQQTKELYLTRAVEVQPIFHREVLTKLSDLTSQSILELDAWTEGDHSPVIFAKKSQSNNGSSITNSASGSSSTLPDSISNYSKAIGTQDINHYNKDHRIQNEDMKNIISSISSTAIISSLSPGDSSPDSPSSYSANRVTDDLYYEFIKTASTNDDNTKDSINEWIWQLAKMADAKERITHIFMLSISTSACNEALLQLYNSGYVNIHAVDEINGRTCLHEASAATTLDRKSIVTLAIDQKIDVTKRDIYGRTALHYACINNRTDLIPVLLNNGSNIEDQDQDNMSPLLIAITHQYSTCVMDLVRFGASIYPQSENSYVPLNLACQYGGFEVVEIILKQLQKLNKTEKLFQGHNANRVLVYESSTAKDEMDNKFLQQSFIPDAEGLFPIHVVARNGHHQLVSLLKEYDANINQIDKLNSWTALFYAASEGHPLTISELLKAGATTNFMDEEDFTALYYAAWEGHIDCMKLLTPHDDLSENKSPLNLSSNKNDSMQSLSLGLDLTQQTSTSNPTNANISNDPTVENAPGSSTMDDINMTADLDDIPDLSLPPPILPLRRYGHNYLEQNIFVQLYFNTENRTPPIKFYNEETSALIGQLRISSKNNNEIIPKSLLLPIDYKDQSVSFQINSLQDFSIDFEIYPTFGTRIIAKTTALSNLWDLSNRNIVNVTPSSLSSVSLSEDNNTSHQHCTLPLFDMRLKTIGELSFSYQIIKPYSGVPLEISKYDTYWKSTGTSQQTLSFVTESSLCGQYIRLPICLTADLVPVVNKTWYWQNKDGLKLPINLLCFGDLLSMSSRENDGVNEPPTMAQLIEKLTNITKPDQIYDIVASNIISLADILKYVPVDIKFEIDVLYPMQHDKLELDLAIGDGRGLGSTMINVGIATELNQYVDLVLTDLFNHARQLNVVNQSNRSITGHLKHITRNLILVSSNPDVCSALNWKQPNYPVFFAMKSNIENNFNGLNSSIFSQVLDSIDRRCISVKEAVSFSSQNNLLGIIVPGYLLETVPRLKEIIRQKGLVLAKDGTNILNDMEIDSNVNGTRSSQVIRFVDTIDM
ncbi:ankyrin [Nadsonia fulvescens var. elongata DSM 6958]|uniref:Ankyrin n=1 Tax=Nadsonia fulvescens var. elongata DSM 6958 TaxID=857566 RepID=A0A1E3PET4_9ASCO|nr:ankyrin [Nadsonia fulvescens var. elongata DSM 6958]